MEPVIVDAPPTILRMPWKNKTYAVSGGTWLEVPSGTTLSNVGQYMVFRGWDRPESIDPNSWEVRGSTGKIYTVKQSNEGTWSCTCPGYGFRRRCKHVENARRKLKAA